MYQHIKICNKPEFLINMFLFVCFLSPHHLSYGIHTLQLCVLSYVKFYVVYQFWRSISDKLQVLKSIRIKCFCWMSSGLQSLNRARNAGLTQGTQSHNKWEQFFSSSFLSNNNTQIKTWQKIATREFHGRNADMYLMVSLKYLEINTVCYLS